MTTAKATRLYTADDLFQMGDDARFELIEGELFEMAPPIYGHGKVGFDLGLEIGIFIRSHSVAAEAVNDVGFLLSRDPDTVLAPDISIISAKDAPLADTETGYANVIPLLAVEVVSPSNRRTELQRKVEIYMEAGVRLVWIVDKRRRSVTVHRADGTTSTLRQADSDALDGENVLPGFQLPLADLFGG